MATQVDDEAITSVLKDAEIDPDALEAEAEALTAAALEAISTPPSLLLEAAGKRALAAAERNRAEAAEAVRLTSLAVGIAEDKYNETEEPERVAAGRAVEALQVLQRIHAARRKALDEQAPVGDLNRLGLEIKVAEETAAELDAAVELAVCARQKAFEDLEQCRRVRQQARTGLERAEAAVANPSIGGLPARELFQALMFCFPYRIIESMTGGPPLTGTERLVCQGLSAVFADATDAIPAGAQAKVAAGVLDAVRKEMHGINIAVGRGQFVNAGQALGLPAGGTGR